MSTDGTDVQRWRWEITLMGAGTLRVSIGKPIVIANPGGYAVVVLVNTHAHSFSLPLSLVSLVLSHASTDLPTRSHSHTLLALARSHSQSLTLTLHSHTLFHSVQSFLDEEARSVMSMVVLV